MGSEEATESCRPNLAECDERSPLSRFTAAEVLPREELTSCGIGCGSVSTERAPGLELVLLGSRGSIAHSPWSSGLAKPSALPPLVKGPFTEITRMSSIVRVVMGTRAKSPLQKAHAGTLEHAVSVRDPQRDSNTGSGTRARPDSGPYLIDLRRARWWSRTGSNRRPLECHSSALPTELRPHEWRGLRNIATLLASVNQLRSVRS